MDASIRLNLDQAEEQPMQFCTPIHTSEADKPLTPSGISSGDTPILQ